MGALHGGVAFITGRARGADRADGYGAVSGRGGVDRDEPATNTAGSCLGMVTRSGKALVPNLISADVTCAVGGQSRVASGNAAGGSGENPVPGCLSTSRPDTRLLSSSPVWIQPLAGLG